MVTIALALALAAFVHSEKVVATIASAEGEKLSKNQSMHSSQDLKAIHVTSGQIGPVARLSRCELGRSL